MKNSFQSTPSRIKPAANHGSQKRQRRTIISAAPVEVTDTLSTIKPIDTITNSTILIPEKWEKNPAAIRFCRSQRGCTSVNNTLLQMLSVPFRVWSGSMLEVDDLPSKFTIVKLGLHQESV